MRVTAVAAGRSLPCHSVPPGPKAAAHVARFCASAAVGVRPWNPASSIGWMPACAYCRTIGAMSEAGVAMSNSRRACLAFSSVMKPSCQEIAEPLLMPIWKLAAVDGALGAGEGLVTGAAGVVVPVAGLADVVPVVGVPAPGWVVVVAGAGVVAAAA